MNRPARLFALLLPALLSGPAGAQEEQAPPQPASLFAFETLPAPELWFEVRARASTDERIAADDPLRDAIGAVRAVTSLLAAPEAWLPLDTRGATAEPGLWLEAFDGRLGIAKQFLAEGVERRELKEAVLVLGASLDSAAAQWLEEEWPRRLERATEGRARLEAALNPEVQQAAWARITRLTTMRRPPEAVRVHLVTAPVPPESTLLMLDGRAVGVVSLHERSLAAQAEAVLHELLHDCEARPAYPPNLYLRIRRHLEQSKIGDAELVLHVSHTLHGLTAAEVVRLVLDPEHVDLGVNEGSYARVPGVHAVLAPLWRRYSAGELGAGDFKRALGEGLAELIAER